jgi:hypothetical protein
MKVNRNTVAHLVIAVLMVASVPTTRGDTVTPVTGWAVHNGTSTVGGTASDPTFTPGDNLTLMAPFSAFTLTNDGDFIEAQTTMTLNTRTANTGTNALNTQLRFGLFNGPSGAIVSSDIPNNGFIIEYANLNAASPNTNGRISEQTSAIQVNPFTSPTQIGNGTQDVGSDSIYGANPGPVTFDLRLTRNGGKIDLTGTITGTDSGSGNPYISTYSVPGYSSATFPADGAFTFNRIGLFLGANADATNAALANSSVTTPEPAPAAVLAGLTAAVLFARRSRRGKISAKMSHGGFAYA